MNIATEDTYTTPNESGTSLDDIAESLLVDEDDGTDAGPIEGTDVDAAGDVNAADAEGYDDPAYQEKSDETDADDEGAVPDEQSAPEALFTVKVNGQPVQVTLGELQRGYAGQAYIQQGMEEVSRLRKEAETVYSALLQERAQSQYQQAQTFLPQPPDRALLQTDPIAYLEADVAYREAVQMQQQLEAQRQQTLAQQAQIDQQAHAQLLAEQRDELIRRIPAFADASKAGELTRALASVGAEYGYQPTELAVVTDARALNVLHDAMQWRRHLASRGSVDAKLAGARPVVRSGARQTPGLQKGTEISKARARMRQSGSVDDVAAYLIANEG